MVPFFVGYALIVWYFVSVNRRRVLGAIAVLLGLIGLLALNYLHIKLGHWTNGEIYVPVMQSITYPYTVLVVAVGAFIWSIPRDRGDLCTRCRYSLEGLEPGGAMLICPECGFKNAGRAAYRRSGVDRHSLSGNDDRSNARARVTRHPTTNNAGVREAGRPIVVGPLAAQHPPDPAHNQDRERQPADERPAERAEATL